MTAPAKKVAAEVAHDHIVNALRTVQVTAELVDTMMLAVGLMVEDQKRLMKRDGASSFLVDNELWHGMGVMLETVRGHMQDIQKSGEAAEIAAMIESKA
ncbi:hypothetical protein [uncultured Sphingomonas sp.]|uniref:hypothetical protein n=1 Tax=uncultured Sphingomonas sp. TaxID=158754 RepID=UPI00374A341A